MYNKDVFFGGFMREIIVFIVCFLIVLFFYEIIFVIPMKKYRANKSKRKKEKKELAEIRYLVYKYKLDLEKVNYNQLLQIVALTSSLDITIIVTIISFTDSYLLSLVLCVILVIPIIMISFWLVFRFYKKRGMIKDV